MKSGAANGLNTDCQTDFSTRGAVKNGRGAFYDNSYGAGAYNPYGGYYVIAPPTYGGNFCNQLWGGGSISSNSCYNMFGWTPPQQPTNSWGYNSGCDFDSIFTGSYQSSCGYNYFPQQQPVPVAPYYPGGWGYGGSYGYGAPTAPTSGNPFAGNYQGYCTTHYKTATPATCPSTLIVDNSGYARIPGDGGCFSPVDLSGQVQPGSISLRSGGWAAQPAGQTLNLMLSPPGGIISASGSGGGISDTAYTYECSYQKY